METRTASRFAWVIFGGVALCFLGSLVLVALIATHAGTVPGGELTQAGLFLTAMFSFPVVGVLVATRRPRNAIGWLLLAIGLVWELVAGLGGLYVIWGFRIAPGSVPRPDLIAGLTSSAWVPGVGLMGTFLILLFPDGRLPARRWKPLAWICGLVLLVLSLLIPLTPGPLNEVTGDSSLPPVANPLGVEALPALSEGSLFAPLLVLLALCILASAWSLIERFRRSHGRERYQLKWLVTAAGIIAALFFVSILASLFTGAMSSSSAEPTWLFVLDQIGAYSFVFIPAAVGIAILRHRLYDIDVIINRALVYGTLTVVLALVYVAGAIGIGGVLREVGGQESNGIAVAASTLALAGLFRPARARLQAFIDRRFYRQKYDAEQTLADFSTQLRDLVALDDLKSEMLGVVHKTMHPTHASLWLKAP